MISFTTVCIGEERRSETMHLLNDLRNLNFKTYLLTNIHFDLEKYQLENVILIKNDVDYFTDFERFKVIKKALQDSNDFVYYLDCDSRFFNFRDEKFDGQRFEKLLQNTSFDIMCSWIGDPIRNQLDKPNESENRSIRNFQFGHEKVIEYLNSKIPNLDNLLGMGSPLEGVLIFKNHPKLIDFCDELLEYYEILKQEDLKFGRNHIALGGGLALSLFSQSKGINLNMNPISHHFFKPNFEKELFPFNFKINKNEKILPSNHILL